MLYILAWFVMLVYIRVIKVKWLFLVIGWAHWQDAMFGTKYLREGSSSLMMLFADIKLCVLRYRIMVQFEG